MSETVYTYTHFDFPDEKVDPIALDAEIRGSGITNAASELLHVSTEGDSIVAGVAVAPFTCSIVFANPLSTSAPDDKGTLDGNTGTPAGGLIAAHIPAEGGLQGLKDRRYAEIDSRTEELIKENGFVHNGKTFSLSSNAQRKWLGLVLAAGTMAYPLPISTKDEESYSITGAAEVMIMYGTMVATVAAEVASGKAYKDAIFAASTKAAVDGVVDTR